MISQKNLSDSNPVKDIFVLLFLGNILYLTFYKTYFQNIRSRKKKE